MVGFIIYLIIGLVLIWLVFEYAAHHDLLTDEVLQAANPIILIIVSCVWPFVFIAAILKAIYGKD